MCELISSKGSAVALHQEPHRKEGPKLDVVLGSSAVPATQSTHIKSKQDLVRTLEQIIKPALDCALPEFFKYKKDQLEIFKSLEPYEVPLSCGTISRSICTLLILNGFKAKIIDSNYLDVEILGSNNHEYICVETSEGSFIVDGTYKQFLTQRISQEELSKLPDIALVEVGNEKRFFSECLAPSSLRNAEIVNWQTIKYQRDFFGINEIVYHPSTINFFDLTETLSSIWKQYRTFPKIEDFITGFIGHLNGKGPKGNLPEDLRLLKIIHNQGAFDVINFS
jgi:hypothetical protein